MGHFNDVIDLGPELFASGDETVICWRGENYYRSCNEFVKEFPDGRRSHCVKRVNHNGRTHEDWDGNVRNMWSFVRYFGWWSPKNEKEEWYTQGWNNGAITALVIMTIIASVLFIFAQ